MGSILYIKECPPRGGDTLFASMYAAYEALSDRNEGLSRRPHCGCTIGESPIAGSTQPMAWPTSGYPRAEHPWCAPIR